MILTFFMCLILALPAAAESLPSQAATDAAGAIVAMHNAVMKDVLDSDGEFSELVGADGLYMLYSDMDAGCYLMVTFEGDRAKSAVIQAYSYTIFESRALLSAKAMYLPFMPDGEEEKFVAWLSEMAEACAGGADVEMTYYYGKYAMCAVSAYHGGDGAMYTAAVTWYGGLSAEEISTIME